MRVRIFALREHYTEQHRKSLNDILKAFWYSAGITEPSAIYRRRIEQFELAADPEGADVHLLTMKWPHYLACGIVNEAIHAVETARRARKPIAVFSGGDSEANFPVSGDDIHVFQASAYRSRTKVRQHGMPPFFDDPLPLYCNGQLTPRPKASKPAVGFCGQAGSTRLRHAGRAVRNRIARVRWRIGRTSLEPPPFEHTWFRHRVLDSFERSNEVTAKFVLRTQYRAGLGGTESRDDATQTSRREFIDNVLSTDYTVGVRGAGNFSVRFYEALALGRMSAFIDTDCVLPFHTSIDWRRYVAWIDERDVDHAGHITAAHYSRHSSDELEQLQRDCRQLWETRLTPDGFYGHFHEHFPHLAGR
jgi:hypothetical protein